MTLTRYVALGIAGTVLPLAFWSFLVEPRLLEEEEEIVDLPALPAAWHNRRIGFASDFQIGMRFANVGTVQKTIRRLVEARPALALLGGDFIYRPTGDLRDQIERVADLIRPLPAAGIPTYAVLGNHDYAELPAHSDEASRDAARSLAETLEATGVTVLHNRAVALAPPPDAAAAPAEDPLYLVGIGSHLAGEDRPLQAIAQVPAHAPRLVLLHNPASFAELPPGTAPFAIAGHTHGGQVRLPLAKNLSWNVMKQNGGPGRGTGWLDGYGEPGNRLYVNRGIGFSVLPVRLNCRPELTFFTLRRHD